MFSEISAFFQAPRPEQLHPPTIPKHAAMKTQLAENQLHPARIGSSSQEKMQDTGKGNCRKEGENLSVVGGKTCTLLKTNYWKMVKRI